MVKHLFSILLVLICTLSASAQLTPEITSWVINTTGDVGYNNIPSNVQQVQYSTSNVYVSANCIPSYTIGPWQSNPNTPTNQNFVFKITRNPVQNTGSPIATSLGHIGIWSNGVSIFNAKDGMSYNNAGVWNRDALYWEGISFDNCLGHPAPGGEYHHHVNPKCLYDDTDSTNHSPIIGYAFDGFPIYGAYGFQNTDGTGPIDRMKSSYVKNTYTTRTNGPDVNTTYPMGCFVEDYTFVSGSGDLDASNGRFCITPDYPSGIYAYFVTIDYTLYPQYPYVIGPNYYGIVQSGNTGPGSGHVTITESVTAYNPTSVPEDGVSAITYSCYPNPSNQYMTLFVAPGEENNIVAEMSNLLGETFFEQTNVQPAVPYTFDMSELPSGIYFLHLTTEKRSAVQKVVVRH